MKRNAFLLPLAAVLAGVLTISGAHAGTSAGFSVDWRGLPNVEGILRDNSKANYGFVNFVAFGPGWAYTAQDYAAKEHKKDTVDDPKYGKGLLFTGKIWAGSRGLAIREEFYEVGGKKEEGRSGEDGRGGGKVHVRWTISALDRKPMKLERAYLRFPLSRAEFAGGKAGPSALPEEYGEEWIGVGPKNDIRIVSKDGAKELRASVESGNPVVQDARKDKQDRFEFRIDFPNAKDGASSTVEFDVSGVFADPARKGKVKLDLPPPPAKLAANDGWCVFPYTNEIKPGTILDFSKVGTLDAPAGKYGFAKLTKDGHFAFEKNPKPTRFVGGNLCFDANFLPKDKVPGAVRDFVRRGWNTIRFHHIDITITKDEWNKVWNRMDLPELSPTRLDQLDFMMAECKKAGIYMTFDLYAMGALGSCDGMDGKPLNTNTVKAWVPVHKPAEDQWFRRAMEMFNHVNPYTGVAWKDEPAILFVTLMNEDSINSCWWGAADKYVEKYNAWAAKKGYPKYEKKGIGDKREFAEFLHEVKAAANRRMAKRLHDAGVHAFATGGNWWDTMQQAYEREALELVDNHGYGDHPQPSYQKLPFHVNQTSDISGNGGGAYNEPVMKAPSRILGKPFAVTEYNFCVPNQWRADGGLMMGAYAALQDWDAIYRFAWSHWSGNMFDQRPVNGFDISTDPVGQLTERQIVLMFGRRDVKPAEKTYGYGVTRDEAFARGLGDMWAKGLFPQPFTTLAYTSKIGSYVADGGAEPKLACAKTFTAATRKDLPKFGGKAVSDTKEISIDLQGGNLTVSAERTAAVCSTTKAALAAGPLAVSGATTFCNVSASAMDGKALANSKKVLILHITDVLNTDMEFTNKNRNDTRKWGVLPYLAKTGKAEIALSNSNPGLTLYALASDGTRLRKVPAKYEGGAYRFTAEVKAGEGANAPTMMYELAK